MKRTNKIIITIAIISCLLLGIGYAAIQNITLNVTGNVKADPSQANFQVKFTEPITKSDSTKVTAAITDDTNATINVSGLTRKGESVYAIYTVHNISEDLSADLAVSTTNNNTEYFTITSQLEKTSLKAGEATTVKVTVTLTKTPVTGSVNSTIGVQLIAAPVEPGKEGSSGNVNDFSQTPETLALVTNNNIGEYIDFGNDIVDYKGASVTTDDWRILYVEDNTIYAILSDYLPNSTKYISDAGLNASGDNIVYYNNGNTTNFSKILTSPNSGIWTSLANGANGAVVYGTVSGELIQKSYNHCFNANIVYNQGNPVDISASMAGELGNLFVPRDPEFYPGYFFSDQVSGSSTNMYGLVEYYIKNDLSISSQQYGIRPVIAIPTSIAAKNYAGVWTVTQ